MKTYSDSENQFRDQLINKILIASAVFGVIAYASAEFRAVQIGFSYRDIIQLFVISTIIVLTLMREKLNTNHKAICLVIIFSIGGMSGLYTLGILGGTIFVFTTTTVIIALVYSERTAFIYIVLSLLCCFFTAFKFCSGKIPLVFDANILVTSYAHWSVYIVCIGFFFSITYITIYNYRRAMSVLIDKISTQRDELKRTNEELMNAANSVKILSGLLPICSSCKKIRDDKGDWSQIESYIKEHSDVNFTHGICPNCMKALYPKEYESIKRKKLSNNSEKGLKIDG